MEIITFMIGDNQKEIGRDTEEVATKIDILIMAVGAQGGPPFGADAARPNTPRSFNIRDCK